MLLVGGGVLGVIILLLARRRNILFWIIPLALIGVGIRMFLTERQDRIKETGDQILAELNVLDPIARAEVVKYLADKELERFGRA